MATKDLQTLKLKFDRVILDSFVFTSERNFDVTFGIFSVLVTQKMFLEVIYISVCFKIKVSLDLI